MAELKPKLRVSVNKNPTKEGIKVQFVLPQTLEGDAKAQATQKLQSKLNQGLEQYNLTVSQDTDVPYSNVIGFLIPIADIKLLIKNAIGGGAQAEPAPEATPAPEEPMKEIKRMQELAGLTNEAQEEKDIEIDINSAEEITLNGKELDSNKLGTDKKYTDIILKAPDKAFMYKGKPASITAVDMNDGYTDEPKIYLTVY